MKKVAIFVDVQNIYYTTKQAYNCHFDYNAFWREITSKREVIKAIAYAIESNNEKQKQFQNILRGIGFEVKLKPYIQRSDGSAKGDWDVGITIDIMLLAQQVDSIILLSGDGDFAILLDKVKQAYGVNTEAYGVPKLTAKALVDSCSVFNCIDSELLL